MPYWGPGDELLHPTEADALAKSLFPDRDHENRFFIESPRKILAHLLKLRPTPQELCHWIAYADPEIDLRVAGTPLEALRQVSERVGHGRICVEPGVLPIGRRSTPGHGRAACAASRRN